MKYVVVLSYDFKEARAECHTSQLGVTVAHGQ